MAWLATMPRERVCSIGGAAASSALPSSAELRACTVLSIGMDQGSADERQSFLHQVPSMLGWLRAGTAVVMHGRACGNASSVACAGGSYGTFIDPRGCCSESARPAGRRSGTSACTRDP